METSRKPVGNQSKTSRKPVGNQYYCVLQSSRKLLPSTTLHYKARTNYFPVLLCITTLAQTRSQYYRILQNPHKVASVLPYATKIAQSRSQYYRILHNSRKHVPVLPYTTKSAQTRCSTTVYYKTCTNTFQYYRILQNSHKVAPLLPYTTTKLLQTRCSILPYTTKLLKPAPNHSETSRKPL